MSYHLKSIVLECRRRVLEDDYEATVSETQSDHVGFEQRYLDWVGELNREGIAVFKRQETGACLKVLNLERQEAEPCSPAFSLERQEARPCPPEFSLKHQEAKAGSTALSLDDQKDKFCQPVLYIVDDPDNARRHQDMQEPVMLLFSKDQSADLSGIKYIGMHLMQIPADYFDKVYRRFAGIPWDILETERCFLRETETADVDAFYRIYSEPSITAYMENLYPERAREIAYTQGYIKNVYELYGHGVWTVCLKETGEVIGRAGLSFREGYEDPELGFVIGVPWQGRGIATEVCRAVLDFGVNELEFSRVIAFVEPGNEVSRHLLRKLGFEEGAETMLCGRKHLYCVWNRV